MEVSRPPLPPSSWDIPRKLDQPEDEVFGLLDDDLGLSEPEEQRFGKAQVAAQKIVTAVESVMGGIRRRKDVQDRDDEIQDLLDFQQQRSFSAPSSRVAAMDPDLERNIVRLPSSRDFQEFLEAEQQATLFEQYEASRTENLRFGAIGLFLAAALMIFLGVKVGQSYVLELLSDDVKVPDLLAQVTNDLKLGKDAARGALFVAGMLTPVLVFVLVAFSAGELLQGALRRSTPKLVTGVCGVTAAAVALMLLSSGAYLSALAVPVLARMVIPVLDRVTRKAGGQ